MIDIENGSVTEKRDQFKGLAERSERSRPKAASVKQVGTNVTQTQHGLALHLNLWRGEALGCAVGLEASPALQAYALHTKNRPTAIHDRNSDVRLSRAFIPPSAVAQRRSVALRH